MSLKVCICCTTARGHSIDNCPQCTKMDYVWDYQLPDGWHMQDDEARISVVRQVADSMKEDDGKLDEVADEPDLPARPKNAATATATKSNIKH